MIGFIDCENPCCRRAPNARSNSSSNTVSNSTITHRATLLTIQIVAIAHPSFHCSPASTLSKKVIYEECMMLRIALSNTRTTSKARVKRATGRIMLTHTSACTTPGFRSKAGSVSTSAGVIHKTNSMSMNKPLRPTSHHEMRCSPNAPPQ